MTNNTDTALKAKDFATDQDVRWCPGCGDYSILKQVQTVLAELGKERHNTVFVSGIGCSSRFPYYMETYGVHSIHGRAPAIAEGIKMANPDLDVWVVTGDGDGLSIGGNHLMHLFRRNFDLNVLLFNNQIYGLTKGQYSPTSEINKRTSSTPFGSIDHPVNPIALALGCDVTFVARSMDRDPSHLKEMLIKSEQHKGTSFLEIYQNCNIFNDGAFFAFTEKETKAENCIFLVHGEPLKFGKDNSKGIRLDGFTPRIVDLTEGNLREADLWVHDETDLIKAQILSRFFDMPSVNTNAFPRPFGVFYRRERATYEEQLFGQIDSAIGKTGKGDLDKLIAGNSTWKIA
jgi:2-oxoglutarate ferredoxin oxidoreductase subunit beta